MLNSGEGFTIPMARPIDYSELSLKDNISFFLTQTLDDDEVRAEADPDYEQFLADVWVGIVLTLMVLSCVCCMCSCLLYHKFQQWKRNVIESRNTANLEAGTVETELPSYTIASGLPTYQEALEQLKKVKELTKGGQKSAETSDWMPHTPPAPLNTLSVINLFQLYKNPDPGAGTTAKQT